MKLFWDPVIEFHLPRIKKKMLKFVLKYKTSLYQIKQSDK